MTEPFFILNGFWNINDSDCNDHHKRSCIGLQRSSPNYMNPNMKSMAQCYFNGTFTNSEHIKMLIELEKLTRSGSTIENVLHLCVKTSKSYHAKSFYGCIHAYLHSYIQTRKARKTIENDEAESSFKMLQNQMNIHFFVQKVNFDDLEKWPKTAIVSIFHI